MPTKRKNNETHPAFVDVYAELISCNTDPAQYKPYNPHLAISNSHQRVFVHLQVPSAQIESDGMVKKERHLVITAEGMTIMLRRLATEMQETLMGG